VNLAKKSLNLTFIRHFGHFSGDALREAGSAERAYELENRIFCEAVNEDDYRLVVTQLIDHLTGLGGHDESIDTHLNVGRVFLNRTFTSAGSLDRLQADETANLDLHQVELDDEEEEVDGGEQLKSGK
jgi:hypothetical protein